MKRLVSLSALAGALLACTMPASAESRNDGPPLPIRRIVLFSSGVGYFQRTGEVEGNTHIDLHFPAQNVNDLLKSLVLEDQGGGQISTISYDNRNPIEMTLKSFALDLTNNPSLADLLNQARGEQVEITAPAQSGGNLTGTIVGVEHQKQPVGKDQIIDVAQLNLLTDNGLHGIPLSQVQRVRFVKESLDQEFRKALGVLATGHDKQKKTVTLNFSGQGKRPVRVGYITESPVWKTSYRLELRQDKLFLQGWAIVENTTDEDWNNVHLGLVSGRPISFQMDLYEPLFVSRPVIEPELFASLRPPSYNANLERAGLAKDEQQAFNRALRKAAPMQRDGSYLQRQQQANAPASPSAGPGMSVGSTVNETDRAPFLAGGGVPSAATAEELGEYFQYAIKDPVQLPRQKSALLPIVSQQVKGSRVSIYNENVQPKFPLLGLRFKNNTSLHLNQGPITVFENDSYAGDARLPDVQPNESRLISYAVDLGTEVEPQKKASDNLMSVKVVKGILYATYKLRESKTYLVKNRSEHPRTVLIEHPYRSDFKLIQPEHAAERSRDVYRFEVKAEPDKPVKLEVVEEQPRTQQMILTDSDDETVRFYIRTNASSDRVKSALEHALALKAQVDTTQQRLQRQHEALKVIEEDQARLRANMGRVPQTMDIYKRYLKKLDDQETEIENRRSQITQLQQTADEQRKAYENYLAQLNVD